MADNGGHQQLHENYANTGRDVVGQPTCGEGATMAPLSGGVCANGNGDVYRCASCGMVACSGHP